MIRQPTRVIRTVIRWTEEEQQMLAERVHSSRARHPDRHTIALLDAAQEMLPFERRRKVTTFGQVPWLAPALRKIDLELKQQEDECHRLRDQLASLRTAPSKEEILGTLTDAEVLELSGRVLEALTPADVLKHFPPDELLSSIPVDQLVGYAASRVTQDLIPLPPVPDIPSLLVSNGGVPRQAYKPRLLLVGLLNGQANLVRQRIEDRARLTIVNSDHPDKLAHSQADRVIVWADFVSHHHQNLIRKQFKPEQIIIHRGGSKQLIVKVETLVKELAV